MQGSVAEGRNINFIYRDTLKIELIGIIFIQGLEKVNIIFQQDNNLRYTSRYIKHWLLT